MMEDDHVIENVLIQLKLFVLIVGHASVRAAFRFTVRNKCIQWNPSQRTSL